MSGGTRSRRPIASRSRRREPRGCGLHWTEDWGEHSYQHSHQGGSGLDRGASIKLSTSHQIRFRRDALPDLCERSAVCGRGPGCRVAGVRQSGPPPDLRRGHGSRRFRTAVAHSSRSLVPRSARPCVAIGRIDRESFSWDDFWMFCRGHHPRRRDVELAPCEVRKWVTLDLAPQSAKDRW